MKIVLNHKCNFTKTEFLKYQEKFRKIKTEHSVVLCPSALYLSITSLPGISLGAQDVSVTERGSHTGEVASSQLKEIGVEYVLIGHSERREEHHESDNTLKEKLARLLAQGLIPVLCVGETKKEKDCGKTKEVLEKQLSILKEKELKNVIIAYEPVWAIGTGKIPAVEEIDAILKYINTCFPKATLLYGGSVNEENIKILKTSKYIEGYLLGGLSLDPKRLQVFLDLC